MTDLAPDYVVAGELVTLSIAGGIKEGEVELSAAGRRAQCKNGS